MQQPDITKLRLKGFENEALIPTGVLKRVRDVVEHNMTAAEFDGHEHAGRCAGNKDCTRYCMGIDCPMGCNKEGCGNTFCRNGYKKIKVVVEKEEKQVRAKQQIKKGLCVGEYAGFVLGVADYRTMMKDMQEAEATIGGVDYVNGRMFTLVTREGGNWSRLLKHACNPNLRATSLIGVDKVPHVRLYATRDIQPGEVLTINYQAHICNKGFTYYCECASCEPPDAEEPETNDDAAIHENAEAKPVADKEKEGLVVVGGEPVTDVGEENQEEENGEQLLNQKGSNQEEVMGGGTVPVCAEPQPGPSSRCGVIYFVDKSGTVTRKEEKAVVSANKRGKRYELRVRRRGRMEANGNQNAGGINLRSIIKRVARQRVKSAVEVVLKRNLFKCTECSKVFKRRFLLARHMSVHSEVKSYCCEMCGTGFKRLENMNRHKREFHADSGRD